MLLFERLLILLLLGTSGVMALGWRFYPYGSCFSYYLVSEVNCTDQVRLSVVLLSCLYCESKYLKMKVGYEAVNDQRSGDRGMALVRPLREKGAWFSTAFLHLLDQIHLWAPTLWNSVMRWRTTTEVPVKDFMKQWLPLHRGKAPKIVFSFRCYSID